MQVVDFYREALLILSPVHGERESESIARILLEDLTGSTSGPIQEVHREKLIQGLNRVASGEPVQYVTGIAWFYNLKLSVTPDVLIPRPETEEMVLAIRDHVQETQQISPDILDIGTGSGCIPLLLKKLIPQATVAGCDVSPQALLCSQENAVQTGLDVEFFLIDILRDQLPEQEYDIIVSNPPYIPRSELHLMPEHVHRYEPELALFSPEDDPLIFYRVIADKASKRLKPLGSLWFEINEFRAEETSAILAEAGYRQIRLHTDIYGKKRFLSGIQLG